MSSSGLYLFRDPLLSLSVRGTFGLADDFTKRGSAIFVGGMIVAVVLTVWATYWVIQRFVYDPNVSRRQTVEVRPPQLAAFLQ
jgi:hypothetical protein